MTIAAAHMQIDMSTPLPLRKNNFPFEQMKALLFSKEGAQHITKLVCTSEKKHKCESADESHFSLQKKKLEMEGEYMENQGYLATILVED